MNLSKKKSLAVKTLGVGKERIVFVRLDEIKEAITKQDIRDLVNSGAIMIKNRKGRKKVVKSKKKKSQGKIRKNVNKRKEEYVKLTRKLRRYAAELKKQGKISNANFIEIRKKIRNKFFKNQANLKEYLGGIQK